MYVFGSGLSSSVLNNIDEQTTISSYIIRSTFMVVLACHIPYNFYSGKESMLIMVDELRRKSMSYALELTLQQSVMTDLLTTDASNSIDSSTPLPDMMAHLNIETWLYRTLTLSLYAATIAASCVIPSVTVVFGFVSALAVSSIVFTLPGLFYCITYKKYSPEPAPIRYGMAVANIVLGLFLMVFLLASEIIQIANS